jgi:hypothetical protein
VARARAQHADTVTGLSRLRPLRGTRPTGVYLARVRPKKGGPSVLVPVRPTELVEGDESIGIHRSALPAIRDRARAELARRGDRETRKRKAKRNLRKTYRTASAGAKALIRDNERFFENAIETGDPQDHVRDWLAGIDVRRGRGSKRLLDTAKGRAIWDAHKGATRSKGPLAALTWILGRNRSRRWSDVEWDLVRGYEEALRAGDPDLALPPLDLPVEAAETDAEELAMIEETQGTEAARLAATRQNVATLDEYRDELREAYRQASRCIDREERRVIQRRIRDLAELVSDDEAINNETLCEPRGDTWLCDFPGIRDEIRRIRDACEAAPKAAPAPAPAPVVAADDDLDLPWERGEAPPDDLDLPWEQPEPERIPGGLAEGKRSEDFDPVALRTGQAVESEHTSDPAIAREIAKDHLAEDPEYYAKLAKMEKPAPPKIPEAFYEKLRRAEKRIQQAERDVREGRQDQSNAQARIQVAEGEIEAWRAAMSRISAGESTAAQAQRWAIERIRSHKRHLFDELGLHRRGYDSIEAYMAAGKKRTRARPRTTKPKKPSKKQAATLAEYKAADREFQRLQKKAETATKRRADLPAGSSRARVTTANAKWKLAAEARDRRERELEAQWSEMPGASLQLSPRAKAVIEGDTSWLHTASKAKALEVKRSGLGAVWRARSDTPEFGEGYTYFIGPKGATADDVRRDLGSKYVGDWDWEIEAPTETQIINNPHGGKGKKIVARRKKTAKRKTAKRKTAKRKTAKRKTAKRKTAKRKTAKRKTAKRKTAKRRGTKRRTKKKTARREPSTKVQLKRLRAALRQAV